MLNDKYFFAKAFFLLPFISPLIAESEGRNLELFTFVNSEVENELDSIDWESAKKSDNSLFFQNSQLAPKSTNDRVSLVEKEGLSELKQPAEAKKKKQQRTPPSSMQLALDQLKEVAELNAQKPNTFVSGGKVSPLSAQEVAAATASAAAEEKEPETILINFNNVSIIEYLRFISRVSNKNFIFDEADLQFSVTIVSEEPTTLDNVMMALMQELRIHNLEMLEEGNTILIYQTPSVRAPGTVVSDTLPQSRVKDADIVTRVFSLNTASANNVASIITPVLSDNAIVAVLTDTNHIIVTDIASNIAKVTDLVRSVDAPNSSMIIGQYVVRNAFIDILIANAETIMQSIAPGQQITFVAHSPSNSVFIIANPFLVERAIPILQRLDQTDGTTGIFDLDELKYQSKDRFQQSQEGRSPFGPGGNRQAGDAGERFLPGEGTATPGQEGTSPGQEGRTPGQEGAAPGQQRTPPEVTTPQGDRIIYAPQETGSWKLDRNGSWFYDLPKPKVEGKVTRDVPPQGLWREDAQGNWQFVEGVKASQNQEKPRGHWQRESTGDWRYVLAPNESIFAGKRIRPVSSATAIPLGHIEKTKFYLHKLQYRNGEGIQQAIRRIGESVSAAEGINSDLVATIYSVQWLEESNSLVFTGTPEALLKVKELVEEIDTPLRQVFLEMLILQTTIDDAMNYGVNMGSKFGGGNTAGAQAFISGASALDSVLSSSGVTQTGSGDSTALIPSASSAVTGFGGYSLGIIGQRITCGGLNFETMAGVLRAVHDRTDINVVLNPKIITEDNVPAEIFVGINTSFKTQSIANDEGSILTNNFEFRDVGTTLKVTPLLGPTNIVTLDIDMEDSSVAPSTAAGGNEISDQIVGPTTRIAKTKTRVHVPDGYFLVISGMIRDETFRVRSHVPCLGAAPLIGAAFSSKQYLDEKRNLMIFIRPQLIDTEQQIQDLTKHQQNIFRIKKRSKKMWQLDTEEALDWLNVRPSSSVNKLYECCGDEDY